MSKLLHQHVQQKEKGVATVRGIKDLAGWYLKRVVDDYELR